MNPKHTDTGLFVPIVRVGDSMFLSIACADGSINGRKFTITSVIPTGSILIEFAREDGDDSSIGSGFHGWRDGFIEDRARIEWTGVELRRDALAPGTRELLAEHVEGVDYRTWIPPRRFDLAIGNPPFGLMEQFIRCALRQATIVAFLARVSILESAERVAFWQHVAPEPALRVLPDRPSFDGQGTDATAYAWFVFNAPEIRGVRVLDSTPKGVRDAEKPRPPTGIPQRELEL